MKMTTENTENTEIEKNDGGPAFPRNITVFGHQNTIDADSGIGMSLRDWFAGMALSGMCADSNLQDEAQAFAKVSYKISDAMLAERGRKDAAK